MDYSRAKCGRKASVTTAKVTLGDIHGQLDGVRIDDLIATDSIRWR